MPELFAEAPEEVRRYFDQKRSRPSFDWRDVAPEEHAYSFTVAKTAGYDVLDDIRQEVDAAIRERVPFEAFRRNLEPVLRKKGWWGKAVAGDPKDGLYKVVQLGSPRRLRTIYWANTRTAHAAGEWERTQRTKGALPYLLYMISVASHKRPEHLAWVGIILPVDDPFWATHYPPNGWMCQCRVRQITAREARQLLGREPDDGGVIYRDTAPEIATRPWRNKRTGETVRVPVGIDPGWQTNPGKNRARNAATFLSGELDAMTENRRRIAVADLVGSRPFRAIQSGEIPYRPNDPDPANRLRGALSAPVAMLPDALAKRLGSRTKTVRFSVADAEKQARKRRRKDGAPLLAAEDYGKVQQLIDKGRPIHEQDRDVLFVGEVEGRPWLAVIRRTVAGSELFLKSFHPLEMRHLGRILR
ncbi:hypothetical protein GGD81_001369 [Rhodobium orientis]|uniref:Phage head morphogenesis domain-containing protein n=1 Tax=Rhodobium orientis TaxID=34017 RepID=A0A327JL50_9HYPH|nr:phage minor head protein [Rhodobium orientis]MBB4302342.1 hypothetical protein [Rhodobium orientis]MBK5949047.1 hypothetical protein [Rhodobium orientis]RAI26625.1 hypothetical protein CH339_13575 [Rhodobium orientis]